MRTLLVGALPDAAVLALVESLLGDSEGPAATLAGEAQGNPLFAIELVIHTLQQRHHAGDTWHPSARRGKAATLSLAEVILSRISNLPRNARRILDLLAVAGRPMKPSDLMPAAKMDISHNQGLHLLQAERLVSTVGSGSQAILAICHDRIQDAVLSGLSSRQIRSCHRRLAMALKDAPEHNPRLLAHHFKEADEIEYAIEYTVEAAEQAASSLAFNSAVDLFGRLLEFPLGERRREILLRFGEALEATGRGRQAAGALLEAAGLGGTEEETIQLRLRAAGLYLRVGATEEGLSLLRQVADAVDLKMPGTAKKTSLELMLRRGQLRIKRRPAAEQGAHTITGMPRLRLDVCWTALCGLAFVDTTMSGLFTTRGLLLALDAGEPAEVARWLGLEVLSRALSGQGRGRIPPLLRQMRDIAGRLQQPSLTAQVCTTEGMIASLEGRWQESVRRLDQAEELIRGHGLDRVWERHLNTRAALNVLCWLRARCALAAAGDVPPAQQEKLLQQIRDPLRLRELLAPGLLID